MFTSMPRWHIKVYFGFIATLIIITVIIITQSLANEIFQREQRLIKAFASIYEHFSISTANDSNNDGNEFLFLTEKITPMISFPMIIADDEDEPLQPYEDYILNIELDESMTPEEKKEYLSNYIIEMREDYEPFDIVLKIDGFDNTILNRVFYTHSEAIDRLRYFPVIAIVTIGAFIVIGYIAFSNIRRNEQSKVWIGMAKEAAHQLGTPLSSLMAWLEILRHSKDEPTTLDDTLGEMSSDIDRLNTITTRFSKIGSMPEKSIENIPELIEKVCVYFEKRLPHLGRRVIIKRDFKGQSFLANVNKDLFTWVLENLMKNAAEAIETKQGQIYISTHQENNNKILIRVKDTGKGMSAKLRRQVFYPGYTTKQRGWGLGLSLCKRIIEEYHSGKIYVLDSALGKGTTFQIELPRGYKDSQ